MRICILLPRIPFPENGGDVLRINNIARYLRSKNHYLILCTFYNNEISDKDRNNIEELYDKIYYIRHSKKLAIINSFISFICGKPMQCGYYFSRKYDSCIKNIVASENIDLYISHLLRMVPYLERNNLQDKSIIEMTDALSKTYNLSSATKVFSLKKFIYFFEKTAIKKYERKVINNYKKIILVSESDIKYLGSYNNLYCYSNGINCIQKSVTYDNKKICFVGNMRTLQNQDAVMRFVNDILPIIRQEIPDVQFHIVGAEPPEKIKKLTEINNVYVTGFVDSVEEYIKDSCLLVAPVRIAAGIQNKVLIGMACHVPVILTSLIAKAIPELINGENCFIEDDNLKFAERCKDLILNGDLRNLLSLKAFQMVSNNYSWFEKLEGYESFLVKK